MHIQIGSLAAIPPTTRLIIFVGNADSDHLHELARKAEFRGREAHVIQRATELDVMWFREIDEVGLVLGAANLNGEVAVITERIHQLTLQPGMFHKEAA